MPESSPSSSDSAKLSEMRSEGTEPPPRPLPPLAWRTNLSLFIATLFSVFITHLGFDRSAWLSRTHVAEAAQFTGSLLAILLAHEFGHFIAARIHRVEASLPYFIPMPFPPFGTMGAIIRMRGIIPTRRALLDIGAAGPLAGMAVAVPLYLWGVAHSHYVEITIGTDDQAFLGESVLIRLLNMLGAPPAVPGMDLEYNAVAFAAWGGMFVTMINLIPAGQLDGGHVAYALFGPRQNRIAKTVHRAMLAFFFVSLGSYVARDLRGGFGLLHLGRSLQNSMFWLVWFQVLAILGMFSSASPQAPADRASDAPSTPHADRSVHPGVAPAPLSIRVRVFSTLGLVVVGWFATQSYAPTVFIAFFGGLTALLAMERRAGTLRDHHLLEHPPTGDKRLGPARTAIAVFTLLLFAALFMPTPFAV